MYWYGTSMLAILTNYITTLSYDYQADGLEKFASLADGNAVINVVEVAEGDLVRTSVSEVKELAAVSVMVNAGAFDGTPVEIEQWLSTSTCCQRSGLTARQSRPPDSVYSFNLALDPPLRC